MRFAQAFNRPYGTMSLFNGVIPAINRWATIVCPYGAHVEKAGSTVFEARLKVTLTVLGIALAVIAARLVELQIVRGDEFRRRAERALILRPTPLPFVRGSIFDRTGEVLVSDEPCWELRIDYGVLAADSEPRALARAKSPIPTEPRALARAKSAIPPDYARSAMKRQVRRWRRAGRYAKKTTADGKPKPPLTDAEIERAFSDEVTRMWAEIAARFSSESSLLTVEILRTRAFDIVGRVARIRRIVGMRIREENEAHAIIAGLDSQEQIAAREAFDRYPWVHVVPSSVRRCADDATPLAHVLGRIGRVQAEHVAADPNADDPFARYLANERLGISGVERAAEQILRGRRGQMVKDRHGVVVAEEFVEAREGGDVVLTIHAELQRRLYRLLDTAVGQIPESLGGAIVVLDVSTREVLALVSYPSYDPNRFGDLYPKLRDDTRSLPLRFRAVANRYPPGSIVKPLVCMKGLTSGAITLDTRQTCTGYLFDDQRDRWRCWQIHGTQQRKAHGSIAVVEALKGSCNVFMYRLGERLGVDALCDAFDMVGLGKPSGTGLHEESKGINPTPDWLMDNKNSPVYPAHARLFAIGQGEIAVTPIQAANLMATYANGRYRRVTLIASKEPTREWTGLASGDQWAAIRRGIYQVVNDPAGTAYKYARFDHDRYVLCGKTGSATAHPWPTSYRIPYVDGYGQGQVATVAAGAKKPAIDRFKTEHPSTSVDPADVEVAGKWPPYDPPGGGNYSHAWFAGFLQAVDLDHNPDWSVPPRIAFALLVEFGGSGGRTGGPIAKRVAGEILEVFGPDLIVERSMVGVPP